jgi:predicted ferric reductase
VLGMATALSTLAHVAAVIANDPRGVGLLLPFFARWQPEVTTSAVPLLNPLLSPPGRAMAGTVATACLVALAVTSARRRRYEVWRWTHLALSLSVLLATALHIVLIGHLVPTPALVGLLFYDDPIGWLVLRASVIDWLGLGYLIFLALIVVGVGVQRWAVRPMSRDAQYYVTGIEQVSPTVSSVRLRPLGRALRFRPGQFAWLRLVKGPLRAEEHPFTVSSAEQDRPTVEFTIKHTGDWTERLRSLEQGDLVYVDGPYGSFTPDLRSRRGLVLIAGGVGITPMMSILRTAAQSRRWRRSVRLLLADRQGQGLFRDEIAQLTTEIDLTPYELDGRAVTPELLEEAVPSILLSQLEYFICGPPGLVQDASSALDALGVPARRVRTELFHVA